MCGQKRCFIWFIDQGLNCDPIFYVYWRNVLCALEKKCYSAAFGWNVLYIPVRSIWLNVSFKGCISLLIFYLHDLSTGVSGVFQSPAITVFLSVFPFIAFSICLMYWASPRLCAYIFSIVFFFDWFLDQYAFLSLQVVLF